LNLFLVYSSLWLLDMFFLAHLGPVGRLPLPFILCYLLGFLLMLQMIRSCPEKWSRAKVFFIAIVLGIAGRLFFLKYPESNDVFRYIWEGYIQNHGFNPYLAAPDHPSLESLIQGDMAVIWQGINHKDLSAAYPPLMLLIFRGLAAISPTPIFFKCAMLGFDLLVIASLVSILQIKRVQPLRLLLYTANPFVILYAIGEAHLDIIQSAFVFASICCILSRKGIAAFVLLGSAVLTKYLALVALPFMLRRSNLYGLPAIILPCLCFLPFIEDFQVLFHSLFLFGGTMHYNDGIAEIFRLFAGASAPAFLVATLAIALALIYLFEHRLLPSIYLAFGALLLLLPTLHPWYILLIAPLVVVYPSRAWLYLMLAAVIVTIPVMAAEYQTGVFQEIKWLKIIEYAPFFGILIYDHFSRRTVAGASQFPELHSVSVIIPTLNEEKYIEDVIKKTQQQSVYEIIVVDGGSDDTTCEIAAAAGAKLIQSRAGRGHQIQEGVKVATGDAVIVLHADTFLAEGAVAKMVAELNAFPSVAGGAFSMTFVGTSLKLKIISLLNNIRAGWFGISFGDQGQFFRLAAIKDIGSFPAMMLMEDVEFSLRLKKFGRPLFIKNGVLVSRRGWLSKGFSANVRLILTLFLTYLIERRFRGFEAVSTDYYNRYYRRDS